MSFHDLQGTASTSSAHVLERLFRLPTELVGCLVETTAGLSSSSFCGCKKKKETSQ